MRWLLNLFDGAGFTFRVLLRSMSCALRKPRMAMTARLMYENGLKSLPVVIVVAFFSGMIISMQTGLEIARFGEEEFLGFLVAQTFAREFGPFVTCVILVGTVVSAYTAEIGTMRVSEEVDALEVLSIDPVGYLAAPRILALTVMTFFLTLCADLVGIVGGSVVAKAHVGLSFKIFFDRALQSLEGREWMGLPRDLYAGLVKAALTGFVIAGVGCAQGLRAQGGALGVGRAVRRAVITSIVLILVISHIFTWLTYRAFIEG
ncbi:MAG: MlaE family ABC transporter permease [Planctomycetota bacterium]|jgi:phospholipid/cholesterol/gamma-HCH transport system permease protein